MLINLLLGIVSESKICSAHWYGQAIVRKLTSEVVMELYSWEHFSSFQYELDATHDCLSYQGTATWESAASVAIYARHNPYPYLPIR